MTRSTSTRHGLGDPRIPWVVLLDVGLTVPPPDREALVRELTGLAREAGWPSPSATAVSGRAPGQGLAQFVADSPDALRVRVDAASIVLASRHDALDGLGMLTALGRLLGAPVRSSARGVAPAGRARRGVVLQRVAEVALRPQAVVARSTSRAQSGDVFAATSVEGTPRTADLVRAGARAVSRWNRDHARPVRPISVAIGVSTVAGDAGELADRSGYLRLRDAGTMSRSQIKDLIARAPLQPGGGGTRRPPGLAVATELALRMAAPRLGSTLLVSHLGVLEAPVSVRDAAFYPVTGGGSGLSLGATTLRNHTTLTLRARASRHDDEGLQALLALVVDELV